VREERDPRRLTLIELFDRPIPDLPGIPTDLLDLLRSGMVNAPDARPRAGILRDRLAALTLRPASDETVMIPVPPSPDATMRTPVVSATGPTEPDGATIPLDVGWGQ